VPLKKIPADRICNMNHAARDFLKDQ